MKNDASSSAAFDASFDYLIVGAGSAGSVLGNRLSEDGRASVGIVEAGPWDRSPLIRLPAGFLRLNSHPTLTWSFASEPSQQTAGRSIKLPQGKVIGGSSSINGMIYNRGQPEDFDGWRDRGNSGWGYDDVLPFFKRTERRLGAADGDALRGRDGPLPVTDHDWRDPISEAFINGVEEQGIRRNLDYNGKLQEGVGYFQRLIENGRRVSAAHAYLHPALHRKNLSVQTNLRVTRLIIQSGRAIGIELAPEHDRGKRLRYMARRGVIVAAGSLNTAKLLQLSGIGPGHVLQEHGVAIVRELPGVGDNLRDHYAVRIVSSDKNAPTQNEHSRGWRLAREGLRWAVGKPSILALAPSLVFIFAKSPLASDRTDLQFVFTPGSYEAGRVYSLAPYPGMTCGFCQQRPQSSGYVRISSADPFENPSVQPNYMTEEVDRHTVVAALKMVRRFLRSKAMAPYFDRETLPGDAASSDDDLLLFARQHGITSFHFVGTARMGPKSDPASVVDSKLKVHGVDGLRIADASVMPMITSANTYAATLMIAEKASALILGEK